jgi:hypothetical protein
MEIRLLRCVEWQFRIRDEYFKGSLKVTSMTEKIRSNRLSWYGHVIRREESHIGNRVMNINVDDHPSTFRPKKRWL